MQGPERLNKREEASGKGQKEKVREKRPREKLIGQPYLIVRLALVKERVREDTAKKIEKINRKAGLLK